MLIVSDVESAINCFKAWFTEGDYLESDLCEFELLIPNKQRNFYTSQFLDIDTYEFQDGFEDLDIEIVGSEIVNS